MTDVTVLRAGRALVGEGLRVVDHACVEITDGSIAGVSPAGETSEGSETRILEIPDLTLVPGFIDAHVHIGFFDPHLILAGGVTTARDLGWPTDDVFQMVAASEMAPDAGPRLFAAGPMLTTAGGYPLRAAWAPPGTGVAVDSTAEIEATVAGLVALGACVIKVALNAEVGPTLDLDALIMICTTAHEAGLKVTGHVFGLGELDKALDAGMDELAHMLMSPERIPNETIQRMVSQGVAVVPTLSCRFDEDRRIAIDNLTRFREAGGLVVYGTDLGNEGPAPGIDATEIGALTEAGMAGYEIIASATVDSARWLGLTDRGALAPGRVADVIGVEGDPLDDPSCLTNVRFVMREGRIVKGS